MVYQRRGICVVGMLALKGIGTLDDGIVDALCAHRHLSSLGRVALVHSRPERRDHVVEAVGYLYIDKHVIADRKYVICGRCAYLLGCKSKGVPAAVNDGILRVYSLR